MSKTPEQWVEEANRRIVASGYKLVPTKVITEIIREAVAEAVAPLENAITMQRALDDEKYRRQTREKP